MTAHRLLKHFPGYDDVLAYPREQVLMRIKGTPSAEAIVSRLFDQPYMHERLDRAGRELDTVSRARVEVTAPPDASWPSRLNDLPLPDRPVLLYTYGNRDVLHRPTVALFARPPLAGEPYELAQTLATYLFKTGVVVSTGAGHGFDVVVHKLASASNPPKPSEMIVPCGLARLPNPMRLPASGLVKAGGVVISPFPMPHGPFEHDDRERALVQAALADTCVFVEPRSGTYEWAALEWTAEVRRPAFVVAHDEGVMPPHVQAVRSERDFQHVARAADARLC